MTWRGSWQSVGETFVEVHSTPRRWRSVPMARTVHRWSWSGLPDVRDTATLVVIAPIAASGS